ncbi:MAG: leucine--tRNA ligase [Candidatus Pacebacteria bacterium]|nr:leucine--tRNA ligase [Candidatus Paceibacterota bacterium]
MQKYDHLKIERKWQAIWEKKKPNKALDNSSKPKFYGLIEFPYPSGDGLHVGHIRSNTAMDIIARKRRAEGYNVLYPIGWDAFGLPTENYAVKTGIHPKIVTKQNTDTFRRQLKALGFSFDWTREINTTDPAYYRWTQWIFLQFFKKGLAYKKKMEINWCPSCKIGLANEEVVDGKCERCGGQTEKREKEQWMLAITKYAERLDKDLDTVNFLEKIKIQQRNWIGRSEGAEIEFPLVTNGEKKRTPIKILIGTRNPAKIEMIKKGFPANSGITFLSLNDLPPIDDSDLVEGNDFRENARMKSEYYFKKTGIPTLSTDHIVHLENWPKDNGFIVHIRKLANPKSPRATDEELAEWVSKYVKKSGETKTTYHFAISVTDSNGTTDFVGVQKPYMLQGIRSKAPNNEGYVFDSFMKDSDTGEFRIEQPNQIAFEKFEKTIREEICPHITGKRNIKVFTTRADTIFSAAFLILAPEHVLIRTLKEKITNFAEVAQYITLAKKKPEVERTAEGKDKTGVELKGIKAINPADGKEISVWISDFVLAQYGTGAVFADAHDQRDFDFAKKYNIPLTASVLPKDASKQEAVKKLEECFEGEGILFNSKQFDGFSSAEARPKIIAWLQEKGFASPKTTFKLRDWVFSRQRYWGEPIPLIHCDKCAKWIPVPEKDLPVKLPEVKNYKPTDTGESPLAGITKWVNVKCPVCKGPAKRETDTMPNWAGSSWYYLRYIDPKNKKVFADRKKLDYWTPVDWYNGGMEHTTLHLLYSRFWHKFLFDLGLVPTSEPYQKRTSHGLILAEDGGKMSKSRPESIINPDNIIKNYGADTLRIYEMFMGPFDQPVVWSSESMIGSRRFLEKIWRLQEKVAPDSKLTADSSNLKAALNQTIKKVTDDIEGMKFNTAISSMMVLLNRLETEEKIGKDVFETLLILVAPFAPHIAEELWALIGNKNAISDAPWPKYDNTLLGASSFTIVVQVNGKVRGEFKVESEIGEEETKKKALSLPETMKWMDGKTAKKIIYVKNKLVSIVI